MVSRRILVRLVALSACAALPAGCGVQEDRTVSFSPSGESAAFQHGHAGVFVRHNGKLQKIFEPGEDVLAVSTPQWSPSGNHVLFTTAHPLREDAGSDETSGPWEENPEGRIFVDLPVRYTCWIWKADEEGEINPPREVFSAECDPIGYVAAAQAVKWHPNGRRLMFVKRTGESRHALFAFDLQRKTETQVFPLEAPLLLFDVVPETDMLACAVGPSKEVESGLWVGRLEGDDWWRVPESAPKASNLQALRNSLPTWTGDGTAFAFVACETETGEPPRTRWLIRLADVGARSVDVLHESDVPVRDLHFSPDGVRLGFIKGPGIGTAEQTASLHTLTRGGELSPALTSEPVRHFAGWDASGERIAYVTPDPAHLERERTWAMLLIPDRLARDQLCIADAGTLEIVSRPLTGMRVTFPHWSPTEPTISCWGTFQPPYQSLPNGMLRLGLRPGDPAAIVDVESGEIEWMPIDAREQRQIGIVLLAQGDYEGALEKFDRAAENRGKQDEGHQRPARTGPLDDDRIFRYLCLRRLGRTDEADALLAAFRSQPRPEVDRSESVRIPGLLDETPLSRELQQDYFLTECLLGVGAFDIARELVERDLRESTEPTVRLSRAVVLSQLYLLERRHGDYADLTIEQLLPQWEAARSVRDLPTTAAVLEAQAEFDVLTLQGGLALYPAFDGDFLAEVPHERLEALAERIELSLAELPNDAARDTRNLFLVRAYGELGRPEDQQAAAQRLRDRVAVEERLRLRELREVVEGIGLFGQNPLADTPGT